MVVELGMVAGLEMALELGMVDSKDVGRSRRQEVRLMQYRQQMVKTPIFDHVDLLDSDSGLELGMINFDS